MNLLPVMEDIKPKKYYLHFTLEYTFINSKKCNN